MPKQHLYYVYILTNKNNAVIYIGVTNDLQNRVWQHKTGTNDGFTKMYQCNKLVYYEEFQYVQDAISREKQLKAGSRQKKIDLVNTVNHDWADLAHDWYEGWE